MKNKHHVQHKKPSHHSTTTWLSLSTIKTKGKKGGVKKKKEDLVFASEIFELRAKGGKLLFHQIGSDLRDIFTQQTELVPCSSMRLQPSNSWSSSHLPISFTESWFQFYGF